MKHIFTYGSLMFNQVWSGVIEESYKHQKGSLFGFERRCIRNEQYPAIVPGTITSSVDGVIYFNIGSEDLQRLDAFEGSYYTRQTVQIHTENNIFNADAYVLNPSYHHILSKEIWDPRRFADKGLDEFVSTYFGFNI